MVVPIVYVDSFSQDYKNLISWREIDVNKYLKWWALAYPGTWVDGYGKAGNKVIFGHSSYFKKDNGRYKTHFQKIIELDAGEQIWVYKKQADGTYKRFIYIVQKAENISPSKVDILNPGTGKNLTLFTCTPIWNLTTRWMVSAKYYDEEKVNLEKELLWKWVLKKDKTLYNKYISQLKKLSQEKKITYAKQLLVLIDSKEFSAKRDKKSLSYFKLLIVQELFKAKK
jgi:LPXTG-site transpeptidase (sortase) family protein